MSVLHVPLHTMNRFFCPRPIHEEYSNPSWIRPLVYPSQKELCNFPSSPVSEHLQLFSSWRRLLLLLLLLLHFGRQHTSSSATTSSPSSSSPIVLSSPREHTHITSSRPFSGRPSTSRHRRSPNFRLISLLFSSVLKISVVGTYERRDIQSSNSPVARVPLDYSSSIIFVKMSFSFFGDPSFGNFPRTSALFLSFYFTVPFILFFLWKQ